MPSSAPSPRLTKSTALAKAQTLAARVQALLPTLTTDISPVTVYQPACQNLPWGTNNGSTGISGTINTGNVFIGGTGNNLFGGHTIWSPYGVWVAPDANGDGSDYQVQVECFGPGGGGGGGSASQGGGGGGGGEYAAEPSYTVTPGKSYVWVTGSLTVGGVPFSNLASPGASGSPTVFDALGVGLPGGVVANGGQGGDQNGVGTAGAGGTGSANTIHFNGGAGAASAVAGGGGGGAGGGSGGTGGNGGAPSGSSGGAKGTPIVPPASIAQITNGGFFAAAGGNAGTGTVPGVCSTGGGGGGCGDLPAAPSGGKATFGFTAAATYNGTDANGGASSGALYNPSVPGSNSILFTGAGPNDYASGAKNSLLIMDPSIYQFLGFTPSTAHPTYWKTSKTVQQVLLTVFNANPNSGTISLVDVSVTYDTALPGSYTGSTIVQQTIATIVIPAGAASATIDLSNTPLYTDLTGAWPTRFMAISLGPGSTPGVEAYGTPTSQAFSAQVYGPGAVAADGVTSLAPVITVIYANTSSDPGNTNVGGAGGAGAPGGIFVSFINSQAIPIAGIEPFATVDSGGNTWAQGITGPAVAWDPVQAAGGVYVPETWHSLGTLPGYSVTVARYRMTTSGDTELDIVVTGGGSNAASASFANSLPAPYRLGNGAASKSYALANDTPANETATGGPPRAVVASGGGVSIAGPASTTAAYSGTCFIPTS